MGALTLGPLVMSLDRAYAGLGFAVLLLAAEWLARRGRPEVAAWAWRTALVTFVAARLAFVVRHLDFYASDPLAIVAIWQGGFAPWWGVAAGAVWTIVEAARQPRLRALAPQLAVAALAAWTLPAALLTPSAATAGVTLPELRLETLDGEVIDLGARGVPTLVNVWATWCPPCRRELPLLVAAAAASDDVRILLVNAGETPAAVGAYLERHGLDDHGIVLDRRNAVGEALRVAGLPTTLAFDGEGRLVAWHVGEVSAPTLRGLLERARAAPSNRARGS
jgi:cytochrome c biogenesis protein CcmG, thiol:disulfide interchange protein DsbE